MSITRTFKRALTKLFFVEKKTVSRKRMGKLAGRRVVSEQTNRRMVIEWEHIAFAVFLLFVAQEYLAHKLMDGGGVTCLLYSEPMFCDLSGGKTTEQL